MASRKLPLAWRLVIGGLSAFLGVLINRLLVPPVFAALGWSLPQKLAHMGIGVGLIFIIALIGYSIAAKFVAKSETPTETFE